MICTMIISYFPEFLILFSFGIQALYQCLLPGIFWAASASISLPPVLDNWWAPISHWKFLLLVSTLTTLHDSALSTIKWHFVSITPNQQSHLNSFNMIIWSSSVLTIPPKFLPSHTAPGHTSRPAYRLEWIHSTGPSLIPGEQYHKSPSILMIFSEYLFPFRQRYLHVMVVSFLLPDYFPPSNSCLEPPSSF